jgi:hypothetical protein
MNHVDVFIVFVVNLEKQFLTAVDTLVLSDIPLYIINLIPLGHFGYLLSLYFLARIEMTLSHAQSC